MILSTRWRFALEISPSEKTLPPLENFLPTPMPIKFLFLFKIIFRRRRAGTTVVKMTDWFLKRIHPDIRDKNELEPDQVGTRPSVG